MQGVLQDKVALVTGAGRGIGRAIAMSLSASGAKVVLNDINGSSAIEVVKEIREQGSDVLFIEADVSNAYQVNEMVQHIIEKFDRIDILVNNAGVIAREQLFAISESSWKRTLDINLKGYFLCGQAVGRAMSEVKQGRIVNIASVTGMVALRNLIHYATSKAGVIMLTRAMALELASYNITVNAVAPGVIMTELTREVFEAQGGTEKLLESVPLKRAGQPEDVANAVLFLVSSAANYITGTTLVVDGGWMAGYTRDW